MMPSSDRLDSKTLRPAATILAHEQDRQATAGAGVAKARAATGKPIRRQSAEAKLAELKRRLLDISDLAAAGAVLRWDQSTYMPEGWSSRAGAPARNAE